MTNILGVRPHFLKYIFHEHVKGRRSIGIFKIEGDVGPTLFATSGPRMVYVVVMSIYIIDMDMPLPTLVPQG